MGKKVEHQFYAIKKLVSFLYTFEKASRLARKSPSHVLFV